MTPWVRVQYEVRKGVFLIQTSKKRHYNEQIKVKWYWSVVVIYFLQDRKQFLWNQCLIKNLMMAHIILITIRPSDFFQTWSYKAAATGSLLFWYTILTIVGLFNCKFYRQDKGNSVEVNQYINKEYVLSNTYQRHYIKIMWTYVFSSIKRMDIKNKDLFQSGLINERT